MSAPHGSPLPVTSSPMRTVFRLAALGAFLSVAMGSLVCATESGAACPTWPGCYPGQVAPEFHLNPLIEFTHRLVAIATGPLVLAAALLGRGQRRRGPGVTVLPWVALVGAVLAGIFGRLVVLTGIPWWLGMIDLLAALTCLAAMTVAALVVSRAPGGGVGATPADLTPLPRPALVARGAWGALALLVPMHLLGIAVAAPGSYTRCVGWPIWQIIDADRLPWVQGLRLALAFAAAALVVATALTAARIPALRGLGALAAALLALELLCGGLLLVSGLSVPVAAVASVTAVALLWALVILGTRAALAGHDAPVVAPGGVARV